MPPMDDPAYWHSRDARNATTRKDNASGGEGIAPG